MKPEEFKDAGGAIVLSVSSLQEAVDALKRLGKPFLNWAGKAERLEPHVAYEIRSIFGLQVSRTGDSTADPGTPKSWSDFRAQASRPLATYVLPGVAGLRPEKVGAGFIF